jgi:hypothetical protein
MAARSARERSGLPRVGDPGRLLGIELMLGAFAIYV